MKAVLIHNHGGREVLAFQDIDDSGGPDVRGGRLCALPQHRPGSLRQVRPQPQDQDLRQVQEGGQEDL